MIILFNKVVKNLPLHVPGANFFLIALIGITTFTQSCNKSTTIGLDVQPNNVRLNVNYIDTTTLVTKTVLDGGSRTDANVTELISSDVLIGTYIDPVFGKTSASLFTQIRLNTYSPDFGSNPQIDSVILSLTYDTAYYGQRPCAKQNINVHRVMDNFNASGAYYSYDSLSVASTDLASNFLFTPSPADSAQLRIPLSANFGQDILSHQPNLSDSTSFQNYLNGLYITTQNTTGLNSGEGNILRFIMDDINTKLTLYYHNDASLAKSSLSFDFSFNSVARFSKFKHSYTSIDPDLAAQLNGTAPAQNSVAFLQAMAGTGVKVEMPYLMQWLHEGKIGINQAELVITIDTSGAYPSSIFSPPPGLVIYGIDNTGSIYSIPDANEGSSYYGGIYKPLTNEYSFNIARYIQQVLDGKLPNNGMYLTVAYDFINPNRVVVFGGLQGNSYRMKLNITRTKLP
jgi:hypothetical protein